MTHWNKLPVILGKHLFEIEVESNFLDVRLDLTFFLALRNVAELQHCPSRAASVLGFELAKVSCFTANLEG